MKLQPAEASDGRRQRAIHDTEPVAPFRVGPADASALELARGADLLDDAWVRIVVCSFATLGAASAPTDPDNGANAQSNSDVTSVRLMVVPPHSDRDAHCAKGAA